MISACRLEISQERSNAIVRGSSMIRVRAVLSLVCAVRVGTRSASETASWESFNFVSSAASMTEDALLRRVEPVLLLLDQAEQIDACTGRESLGV